MLYAGIDAGSRTIKVVLVEEGSLALRGAAVTAQGLGQEERAEALFERVVSEAGAEREEVAAVVATGHGRDAIRRAHEKVTEITCHAAGIAHLHPEARVVIDIGGQDSKVLLLGAEGRVRDFVMNDRCAAGTGRFLEVVAERIDMSLDALGEAALAADAPVAISSMCATFAETEIIGLLAAGESRENIAAGVQESIAARISAMAGRPLETPIFFTGGVALVPGMDRALAAAFGCPVAIARTPQLTGALGAALIASTR